MWSHFYWYTLSNSDPMFIWTPCPTLNPMFIGTPCPTLLLCLLGHPVQLWSYVYWDTTLSNSDPMFIGTPCPTLIPCLLGHPFQLWSHVYWDTLSNPEYSKGWQWKMYFQRKFNVWIIILFSSPSIPLGGGEENTTWKLNKEKFKVEKEKTFLNMSEH